MYSFGVECKNPFKLEKSDEKKKQKDFVGQSLYLFLPLEPFFCLWPSQPERQLLPLTYCTYLKRIV